MRKMKDSGIVWLGNIPSSWRVERVKRGFFRKKAEAHQANPIVLSLARSGVKERDISNNEGQIAESYYNYNPVEKDDLLINPMDLYSGANCSISKIQGVISPAYINLRFKNGYNPEYYDYYFKIQYWMMAFFAHGKGVSFDNRWTLNAETLMNYPIIVPSFEEQCAIVDYLSAKCSQIDTIITKQENIIEKLKEYKLSFIAESVTKGLMPNITMRDSGIDWLPVIPDSWEVQKLNKCVTTFKGYAFKSDEFISDGIPIVRVTEIKNNSIEPFQVYVREIRDEYIKALIHKGDILMTTVGSYPDVVNSAVGQVAFASNDCEGALLNQNAVILRAHNDLCGRYLYYCLLVKRYREHLNLIAHGTANQASITLKELLNFTIPIPCTEEQTEIANYLDKIVLKINASIKKREQLIDALLLYKKSLVFEVVTGKKEV